MTISSLIASYVATKEVASEIVFLHIEGGKILALTWLLFLEPFSLAMWLFIELILLYDVISELAINQISYYL